MDKKKGIILISVLTLLIGLSSFVFIQTGKEKELDNGDTNINEGTKPEEDVVIITPEPSKPTTTVQPNASLQALIKAKEAVKKAEDSLLQEDLDSAKALIESTIKDEKYKKELLETLEGLQAVVDVKTLIDELETLISEAETKSDIDEIRDNCDLDSIIEQTEELEESEYKTELVDRLEEIIILLEDITAPTVEGIEQDERTDDNVTLTVDEEYTFTATLNGEEIELEDLEEIDAEGEYLIAIYDKSLNKTEISFIIDKTPIVIAGIDDEEYVYNKTGVIPTTIDEDIKDVVLMKNDVKVDGYTLDTAIKDVGEYVLTVKDELDRETVVEFTITKAEPTITLTEPTYKYNAEKQEFEISVESADELEVEDSFITITYYDMEDEDTALLEAPTLPGSYKLVIEVSEIDGNHKATKLEKTFEITKALTEIELTEPNLTYDENEKEYGIKIFDAEGTEVTTAIIDVKYYNENDEVLSSIPTKAGKYKLVVTVEALDENHLANSITKEFEIVKAEPKVDITEPTLSFDEEKKEYLVEVSDVKDNVITNPNVTIEYYDGENTLLSEAPILPGNYKVVITVEALDENYTNKVIEKTFEIAKAKANIELTEPSYTYDGTEKQYLIKVFNVKNEEVLNPSIIVEYYDMKTGVLMTSLPKESGSYKIVVKASALDENYEETIVEKTFEITKSVTTNSELVAALNNAKDGDIIVIANGTYNIDSLVITKAITLKGESSNGVIINIAETSEIGIQIKDNAVLENITIIANGEETQVIKASTDNYIEVNGVETLELLDNVTIKNISINGGKTGLTVHGVENAVIENITITDIEELAILFASTDANIKDSNIEGDLKIEYKPLDETDTKDQYPETSEVTLESGNTIDGNITAEGSSFGNVFVGENLTKTVDSNTDIATYTQN